MVAMAEADATLTPAMLSPEIQASRRTIAGVAGRPTRDPRPPSISRSRSPSTLLEQRMVRSALDRSHGKVEEAATAARDLAQGPVPEAPPLGAAPAS